MFFVLNSTSLPCRRLDFDDYIKRGYKKLGIKWFRGKPFENPVPNPLQIRLLPLEDGNPDHAEYMPPYISGCSNYFFRDDLLETLTAFGVNNLDVYPVEMYDPDSGKVYSNYKAVNIIGAIEAADMEKSTYSLSDGIPLIDVSFEELVLRNEKIDDLLIFRLAENLMTILVHESVRKILIEKGFIRGIDNDAIEFYKIDETAIL